MKKIVCLLPLVGVFLLSSCDKEELNTVDKTETVVDNIPPTFDFRDYNYYLNVNYDYNDFIYNLSDNCSEVSVSGDSYLFRNVGENEIEYILSDLSNNITIARKNVNVLGELNFKELFRNTKYDLSEGTSSGDPFSILSIDDNNTLTFKTENEIDYLVYQYNFESKLIEKGKYVFSPFIQIMFEYDKCRFSDLRVCVPTGWTTSSDIITKVDLKALDIDQKYTINSNDANIDLDELLKEASAYIPFCVNNMEKVFYEEFKIPLK